MCSVSSLYGDQAITGLLKSCKGWEKVLWEIQFEFKIQIDMDHSNTNTIEEGLNIGKRLSCTWTTGAGPRIRVLRDYPAELKIMALEQVNLSPRIKPGGVAFGSNNSNIIPALPIPSPRSSPKIHLSPRLHYMGLPSPIILKQSQFTK